MPRRFPSEFRRRCSTYGLTSTFRPKAGEGGECLAVELADVMRLPSHTDTARRERWECVAVEGFLRRIGLHV
jgi:hypothetical protein